LGEVTLFPVQFGEPGRRGGDRFLRDRQMFTESIEAVRVALMLSPNIHDVRTLVISSAVSREGKSSLASSLAMSLAKSTRKPTLLIDADLRCPRLHVAFGIAESPGLVDVVMGGCRLDEAVVRVAAPALDILPAGRLTSTPHDLLHREELADLLALLRTKYRYVIIDSPPILAASEALVLASAADGTLVCTMRDRSRGPQFRMACERLAASGARVLGTVFSGIPSHSWAYKYGGYGYGGYGYGGYGYGGNGYEAERHSLRFDADVEESRD
jgi:capsular exopolysaccharide synthesis family protein